MGWQDTTSASSRDSLTSQDLCMMCWEGSQDWPGTAAFRGAGSGEDPERQDSVHPHVGVPRFQQAIPVDD